MRDASTARVVVIERDQSLVIERYTRKVGNQFVSSILTGNGAVVFANAPSAELAFICLLADDKRAGVLRMAAARDASAMAQCMRDDTTRANPALLPADADRSRARRTSRRRTRSA